MQLLIVCLWWGVCFCFILIVGLFYVLLLFVMRFVGFFTWLGWLFTVWFWCFVFVFVNQLLCCLWWFVGWLCLRVLLLLVGLELIQLFFWWLLICDQCFCFLSCQLSCVLDEVVTIYLLCLDCCGCTFGGLPLFCGLIYVCLVVLGCCYYCLFVLMR